MHAKTSLKMEKENKKSIGIFDSGFGGLTVVSAVNKLLPHENILYFGDTAHVPYGSKSKNTVIKFSKEIAAFLLKKNVKLIIVACNTASAFALDCLQKNLTIPVIGVIHPGAKAAAASTKNKKIGVIGTEGTIKSGSYSKTIKKLLRASVFEQACPLFVPLVEEGWNNNAITKKIAEIYLSPLAGAGIDTLVLGCTHYPLLKNVIKKIAGKKIKLIDSADATAEEVKNTLTLKNLFNKQNKKSKIEFFVSDNPEKFKKIGGNFLKNEIGKVAKIDLEKI